MGDPFHPVGGSSDFGVSVRSRAHAASSSVGVRNTCSTRAEVSRLNCG